MDEIIGLIFRFLGRIFAEIFFEIIFRVIAYVTGFAFLFILTLGRLPIPFRSPYWTKKRKPAALGFWAQLPYGDKIVHPDIVSVVGLLVWGVFFVGLWLKMKP